MSGQLKAEDIMRLSVDQISRQMFKLVPHLGTPFPYRAIWERLIVGPVSPDLETKVDDAFFRLVDRNLIRWWEGTPARFANYALTERGRSSQYAEGLIDDPEPFLGDIEAKIGCGLDPVLKQYLREAVAAFHDERLLSSQFCLGATAERVAFLVRDWIVDLLPKGNKLKKVELVGQVVTELAKGLADLKKARSEWGSAIDAFADSLESCATVYRRSRNEVGHPTEVREINEDEITVMMTAMRRRYIPAAYGLLVLGP